MKPLGSRVTFPPGPRKVGEAFNFQLPRKPSPQPSPFLRESEGRGTPDGEAGTVR